MKKYTQRALRQLVASGNAIDVTHATIQTRKEIEAEEGSYTQVGYAEGVYGCNGLLLRGNKTGTLYAVTKRTSSIYVF